MKLAAVVARVHRQPGVSSVRLVRCDVTQPGVFRYRCAVEGYLLLAVHARLPRSNLCPATTWKTGWGCCCSSFSPCLRMRPRAGTAASPAAQASAGTQYVDDCKMRAGIVR